MTVNELGFGLTNRILKVETSCWLRIVSGSFFNMLLVKSWPKSSSSLFDWKSFNLSFENASYKWDYTDEFKR